MTPYVMEHLPDMVAVQDADIDLEQVNFRTKHPFRLRERFKLIVPLFATLLIVGLAYMLKANWPE